MLAPANVPAWQIWSVCNQHGRPFDGMGGAVLPIDAEKAMGICGGYGEGIETFERVLFIEGIMFPALSKKKDDPDQPEEIG